MSCLTTIQIVRAWSHTRSSGRHGDTTSQHREDGDRKRTDGVKGSEKKNEKNMRDKVKIIKQDQDDGAKTDLAERSVKCMISSPSWKRR